MAGIVVAIDFATKEEATGDVAATLHRYKVSKTVLRDRVKSNRIEFQSDPGTRHPATVYVASRRVASRRVISVLFYSSRIYISLAAN